MTYVTIYSGPDFDYGLGDGPGTALFIDNLDDVYGVLQEFKGWFADHRFLKVWHNYGFDRHVLWNEVIDVQGLGGDTMHMARLLDSSRVAGNGGYSLESLTADYVGRKKESMKTLFDVPRIKRDGEAGSLVDVPPVEVMQRDPQHRAEWITYAGYDAKGTWLLRNKLEEKLRKIRLIKERNLFDYYWMHMRPFGHVKGIRVDDTNYLAKVEQKAKNDRERHRATFARWAEEQIGPDGLALTRHPRCNSKHFCLVGPKIPKPRKRRRKCVRFRCPVWTFPRMLWKPNGSATNNKRTINRKTICETETVG